MPIHCGTGAHKHLAVCEPLEERRLLSFSAFAFPQTAVSNQDNYTFAALAAGPDGNIWITDPVGERLLRVKPDGSMTQFSLSKTGDPVAISGGPDGNIWYVDDVLNTVSRVTPAGKITAFKIPPLGKNLLTPEAIISGGDGNLWMMEFDDNFETYIARVTPAGQITQFAEPNAQGFDQTLFAGPDGNIYFPSDDAKENPVLGRITPAGVTTFIPLKDDLFSLAPGPNNTLWGTVGGSFGAGGVVAGSIEQISLDGKLLATYKSGAPQGDDFTAESMNNLVVGADGNVWFSSDGSEDQLGRMTPSGAFTELAIPGGSPNAFGNFNSTSIVAMVAGADGNLWYLPQSGDQVVRFSFHSSILASSEYVDTFAGSPSSALAATFVDTGPALPASAYKAVIELNDGTTASGAIAANGHGGFDVTLTQAWPLGTSTATVTITQGSRSATASDFITATAPTPKGSFIAVKAVAGTVFNGNVADFTNIVLDSINQYFVEVDWGDGQFGSGELVPDGKGGAFVQGSHGYSTPGRYSIDVIVQAPFTFPRLLNTKPPFHDPFPIGEAQSPARVSVGVMFGYGNTLLTQAHHPTTQAEAFFKFSNGPADLSHYHATLEWGDLYTNPEQQSVPMTIIPRSGGTFAVKVPVTFAGQGVATYRIVINDDRIGLNDDSAVGIAYGQIFVDYPTIAPPKDEFGDQFVQLPIARVQGATGDDEDAGPAFFDSYNPTLGEIVHSAGKTLAATTGSVFSGDVGTLSGLISNGKNLEDLHATINWGDGTTSTATFTRDAKGLIHVQGKHTYAKAGKYTIVIRCSQTIYQDGLPEYGMPDIRLPSIFSYIRVGGS
jgi:streptogramin lyase